MYVIYRKCAFLFYLPSPGVVSSAETAAEPESAGTSAQQDEDASQDPGNVLI